jgi:anaerobic magnesium-protoporphyrin IX monomethyl ester cyclase
MAKILFINTNKWGRGLTHIWIASHSGLLKSKGHNVKLFDCTFYNSWSHNEIETNTNNNQYKRTDYNDYVNFKDTNPKTDLQDLINNFNPEIVFWSGLSSHINGEGEYVSLQYGYELLEDINHNALLITGGIQATGDRENLIKEYPKIDYLISGESELVLLEIINNLHDKNKLKSIKGITYLDKDNKKIVANPRQNIINNLDVLDFYDYEIFDPQVFFRAYNGKVIKALDYELSRGCIYTCSYCVETVIQNYYGFDEKTKNGALVKAKNYLRCKSAENVYEELKFYKNKFKIDLVRCQDTNFLTINRDILNSLEKLLIARPLNLKLYIETRPEGINETSIKLLKNLGVDGVGMGIELADENFRSKELNRFIGQDRIIKAFEILKKNNIKRTTYNIIGLPGQNEEQIKETIKFNKDLDPDNITVHYYSPYVGTDQHKKSKKMKYFLDDKKNIDPRLRSLSDKTDNLKMLEFYMKNFVNLARA